MDNPNREIQQQQQHSPGFFYVFWVLCVRQVCGHLRGRCQCLLFFGTAARLEKPGINNHLSKPTLVDNPTAHLLSKKLKGEKLLKQCLIFFFVLKKISILFLQCSQRVACLFQQERSKKEKIEGAERLCLDSMSEPSSDWLL